MAKSMMSQRYGGKPAILANVIAADPVMTWIEVSGPRGKLFKLPHPHA